MTCLSLYSIDFCAQAKKISLQLNILQKEKLVFLKETDNVTLRRLSETIVALENRYVLHNMNLCL